MITEFFNYVINSFSCPVHIKKYGFLKEIVAIEARNSRLKKHWQEHQSESKEFILQQCDKIKPKYRKKVLVFGAGLINDLPLEYLSKNFQEIILLDVIFPFSTLMKIEKYPNVISRELDATDVLAKVYQIFEKFKKSQDFDNSQEMLERIKDLIPKFFYLDKDIDLVISLNMLSQLPIMPKSYFENNLKKDISEENYKRFEPLMESLYQALIRNHIIYLRAFKEKGTKVILICDTRKQLFSKDGEILANESSIEGLDEENLFYGLEQVSSWDWCLAPFGELDIHKKYEIVLKVKGIS